MMKFPIGIFKTVRIVFKNLFRPNITIQYPEQRYELPERARWAVEMKLDEDGHHKCTACLLCQKACPGHIIGVDMSVAEDKTKRIHHWQYQRTACMMCGLCVEACPFDAIKMGQEYELAHVDPALMTIDLLTEVDAVKPNRPERPATPAPQQGEGATDAGTNA